MSDLEQELHAQLAHVRQHLEMPVPSTARALAPKRRRHSLRLLIAGVLGTGAVVGGSVAVVGALTGHPSPPAQRAQAVTPATTPPTISTTPPPSAPPPGPCQSNQLAVSVGQGQGAAGTDYYPLIFTNTGAASCTLQGYPGVSFVDGAGHQVAFAAVRMGGQGPVVTVATGQAATSTARVLEAEASYCPNNGQDVDPVTVSGFRVYPPDQTAALFAPLSRPEPICADAPLTTLSIYQFGVTPSSEN
jgi:hypothetical protein